MIITLSGYKKIGVMGQKYTIAFRLDYGQCEMCDQSRKVIQLINIFIYYYSREIVIDSSAISLALM